MSLDQQYDDCINDPASPQNPLDRHDYCEIEALDRWLTRPPPVSLGEGKFPVFFPSWSLPAMVFPPAGPETTEISTEDANMPTQGEMRGDFQYINGEWVNIAMTQRLAPTNGGSMPSWVDILREVGQSIPGNDIIDIGFGIYDRLNPDNMPSTPGTVVTPPPRTQPTTARTSSPGQPPMQPYDPCHPGPKPVWKSVCGEYKWVWPRRRRRKRLATTTDIRDITSLRGAGLKGQELQSWIASHPT